MEPEPEVIDYLRRDLDTVLIPAGSSTKQPVLHIEGQDCPAQNRPETTLLPKPIETFPRGWRGWCYHCVIQYHPEKEY